MMPSRALPSDHRPNIRHLEIHLTYRCNLRCLHCSNLIEQAPSNEILSLAALDRLLADSIRLAWPWEWLVLHGGEASLHPQFEAVCQRLQAYQRDHNPGVHLFLCTNGWGEFVQQRIAVAERYGLRIENSQKPGTPDVGYHYPLSYSPVDAGEDYHLGCFQASKCGIAYTERGFYECSPAASAWRVFGYEPLATSLDEVTVERLEAGFALHCQHCGYARVAAKPNPLAPFTPTWQTAIDAYRARRRPAPPPERMSLNT